VLSEHTHDVAAFSVNEVQAFLTRGASLCATLYIPRVVEHSFAVAKVGEETFGTVPSQSV
jgi:hypothetical protein